MSISSLLALLYSGSLPRRSAVEIGHLCLYFLVAILRWRWYRNNVWLFISIVVIIKIVQALFGRWSYRGGMWSSKVLRCCSMWRLEARSWLL
jgi:hypothetical protein